jgi:hypothetical protein
MWIKSLNMRDGRQDEGAFDCRLPQAWLLTALIGLARRCRGGPCRAYGRRRGGRLAQVRVFGASTFDVVAPTSQV